MQNGLVNIFLIKFNAIIKLRITPNKTSDTHTTLVLEETYHEIKVFMWGEFHRRHQQEDNQRLKLPGNGCLVLVRDEYRSGGARVMAKIVDGNNGAHLNYHVL